MKKIREIWESVTHPPKASELARRELESAKRQYLESKTHAEYYQYQVKFEQDRIKRLEEYLGE